MKILKPKLNLASFYSEEVEKAYTEGIYSDTPANRKLGRAGMSYKDYADKTHKSDDKGDKKNNSDDNSNNKKKDWVKEYPLKLKELIKNSVGQLDGSDKEATDKQVDNIFNSVSDSVDITEKNGVFNVEVNSRAFYRSAQDNDLDFGYGGAEDIGPELDRYLNKNFGKREKEGKKQSPEERIKKDEERREKEAKEKNKFKKESNIAKEKFDKNIIGEIDTSSIKHNMSFSALRKYPLLKDCSNDFVMKLSEAMKGEEDRIVRLKSPSDKPLFAIISSYREKKYPDDASNGYAIILQNNEDPEYAWKISNKGSNGYIDIYKEYKAKLNNSGKQYKLLNKFSNK